MSQIQHFTLFLATIWVLIITPGPDLIFVLSKGASQGKKAGLLSALGITLGILFHTLLAALGLSEILRTSAVAFSMVKTLGATYLIFLGIRSMISKKGVLFKEETSISYGKMVLQGFLSNTLNPKVALFYLAFLPQFIISGKPLGSPWPFLVLGLLFALSSMVFLMTLGYFSGSLGHYLARKKRAMTWVSKISGALLLSLGIKLAMDQQAK
ncbi:LysE family translocator [Flagellimonas olearia]|uniref:LysE family translocator n=1 Tax=Flagellimonas olearia TaxID=552546 RepID=A0A6I1E1I8_9FLAO|nr:LysE family translocator [Allomuricauda olearia]KAB7530289.1 LysE family translocator [Allomuricauda olearia]